MHWLSGICLLLASRVFAENSVSSRSNIRRQVSIDNTTLSISDTPEAPASPEENSPSLPTIDDAVTLSSTALQSTISTTSDEDSGPTLTPDSVMTLSTIAEPPVVPILSTDDFEPFTSTYAAVTLSSTELPPYPLSTNASDYNTIGNESASSSDCTGPTTFVESEPVTEFLTITESFNVTVTASDDSITETPILVTPPPACIATSDNTATVTQTDESDPDASPAPLANSARPFAPHFSPLAAPAPAAVQSTYTVTVTKKTPVPVVVSPTNSGPNFQTLVASSQPPSFSTDDDTVPSADPADVTTYPAFTTHRGVVKVSVKSSVLPTLANAPAANFVVTSAGGAVVTAEAAGPTVAAAAAAAAPPVSASIAADAVATAAAVPATTTIGNVGITVYPSSIAIGSKVVSIPAYSQTTIQVNHETFTVRPSEIVGPGTTYALTPLQHAELVTAAPTPTVVTADGLTLTVGASSAVVDGKTFKLGDDVKPTTAVIHGKTISIGPSGVGLADTTIPIPSYTDSAFVQETADGLTFSVDASEAVISGTTYRIGSGAPHFQTVIHGHTISIGSSGLGFEKTTIKPTTVTTHTTKGGTKSSKHATSASQTSDVKNSALSRTSALHQEHTIFMMIALTAWWAIKLF